MIRLSTIIFLLIVVGYVFAQEEAEPKVTLDIKEGEIREILKLFAQALRVDLVVSPDVKGKITVFFKDVPISRALPSLLRAAGLYAELSEGILYVAPISRFIEEEREKSELRERRLLSAPLMTVIIPLSYADCRDVAQIVRKFLSKRGKVIADPRTNSLIITDIPSKVAEIKMAIK